MDGLTHSILRSFSLVCCNILHKKKKIIMVKRGPRRRPGSLSCLINQISSRWKFHFKKEVFKQNRFGATFRGDRLVRTSTLLMSKTNDPGPNDHPDARRRRGSPTSFPPGRHGFWGKIPYSEESRVLLFPNSFQTLRCSHSWTHSPKLT